MRVEGLVSYSVVEGEKGASNIKNQCNKSIIKYNYIFPTSGKLKKFPGSSGAKKINLKR